MSTWIMLKGKKLFAEVVREEGDTVTVRHPISKVKITVPKESLVHIEDIFE